MSETITPVRILSVDEILAADDLQEEVISIKAWGGAIRVRGLTAAQVEGVNTQATTQKLDRKTGRLTPEVDQEKVKRLLIQQGIVEPRLSLEQVAALSQKSAGAYLQILAAVNRLSGLGEAAREAAEERFPS